MGATVGEISFIIMISSFGFLFGSFAVGLLMDKFTRYRKEGMYQNCTIRLPVALVCSAFHKDSVGLVRCSVSKETNPTETCHCSFYFFT